MRLYLHDRVQLLAFTATFALLQEITNKFSEALSFQHLKNVDIARIFLSMNSFYSCFCKATFCISNISYSPTFVTLPLFYITPIFKECFVTFSLCPFLGSHIPTLTK